MSRRLLVVCLLLVVALPLLSGCPKPKAASGNDLVLLLDVPKLQLQSWQDAAKTFSDAHKVPVTIENVPADQYLAKLRELIAAGTPPDVASIDSTHFPEFAAKGDFTDLTPLLKAQQDLHLSDFLPQTARAFQYQGAPYALPYDISVEVLAYDQDQFELANLPEPTPGKWDWAEFVKYAKTLTRDTNDDGKVDTWGVSPAQWWQLFVWQNGGDVVDDPANPQHSTLSTAAAQGGLQFLADLSAKEKVSPSPPLSLTDSRLALFSGGHAAMAWITRADLQDLNKVPDLRYSAVPLPTGKLAANLALCSGFCIPKNAPHQQQAWQLISYFAGLEGQKALLGAAFTTPPLTILANSPYFPGVGTAGLNPFAAALKVVHPLPFTPRYAEIEAVWNEELPALWSGKATAAEVTAKIDGRVNNILAGSQPTTAWLLPLVPRG